MQRDLIFELFHEPASWHTYLLASITLVFRGLGLGKVWLSALDLSLMPFPHFSVCPSSVLSDASFTSATGTAAAAAAAATSKTVRRNLTLENQGGIPSEISSCEGLGRMY